MTAPSIGLYYNPQQEAMTGIRKPIDWETIIGTQAPHIPLLKESKKKQEYDEKMLALQQEKITADIEATKAQLAQIESLGSAELASNVELATKRNELQTKLTEYETKSNEAIAKQQIAVQEASAKRASLIGIGQTVGTGVLAYKGLGIGAAATTAATAGAGVAAGGAYGSGSVGYGGVALGSSGAAGTTATTAGIGAYGSAAAWGGGVGFGVGSVARSMGASKTTSRGAGMTAGFATGMMVGGGPATPTGWVGGIIGAIGGYIGGGK